MRQDYSSRSRRSLDHYLGCRLHNRPLSLASVETSFIENLDLTEACLGNTAAAHVLRVRPQARTDSGCPWTGRQRRTFCKAASLHTSARMRNTCSRLAETLMLSVLADYGSTCIFTGGMYYRCTTTRPGGWWDSKFEFWSSCRRYPRDTTLPLTATTGSGAPWTRGRGRPYENDPT